MRIRQSEDTLLQGIRGAAASWKHLAGFLKLGMGDDAALVNPTRGYETILTCDWFLEGAHFLRDKHPADAVGWKCLARAVSDVAAMGGVPRCFLLSLALPKSLTGRWLDDFLGGLRRASRRFGCALAGGDTTRQSKILINVTVVGEVLKGEAILRSSARVGDIIYVSGRLGEAEAGLRLVRSAAGKAPGSARLLKKHFYPEPRQSLGNWLAQKQLATAMLDISDGLSSDLARLCGASRVGAEIEAAKLPAVRISESERKRSCDEIELALHGGDDYELLFTVPSKKAKKMPGAYEGVALTAIGKITRGRETVIVDQAGDKRKLKSKGWDPFHAEA